MRLLTVLLFILLLCGCSNPVISKTDFIFNTYVTVTLYEYEDSQALEDCFSLCRNFEQKLSRTITDSEVYQLNNANGGSVTLSDETLEVLKAGVFFSELSDGVFDITIAPLSSLWNFSSATKKPSDFDIKSALTNVDYRNIYIYNNSVRLSNDAQIDLGGIAKGFIADKLSLYLKQRGVKSAIINLGGNVLTVGNRSSGFWNVAIRKPFEDSNIAVLKIDADTSVVTSGLYERFFIEDGFIYHHILDTSTGYPVNNSLASVTIIGEKSIDCDAYSTICFALGLEEGLKYINSIDGYKAVFVTRDNDVFYSEGF